MADENNSVTLEVLAYRVSLTEKAIEEIRDASRNIEKSLNLLAQLEQHHVATREKMLELQTDHNDLDLRVRVLETEMPSLKMVKGWVIAGTIGIVSLFGVALFKMLVK